MFSAKQGHYWYHFYNVWYDAVLDWGLNPGPSALEVNTLPLGYRGGGDYMYIHEVMPHSCVLITVLISYYLCKRFKKNGVLVEFHIAVY